MQIAGDRRRRFGACELNIDNPFGVSSLFSKNSHRYSHGTYHTTAAAKRGVITKFVVQTRVSVVDDFSKRKVNLILNHKYLLNTLEIFLKMRFPRISNNPHGSPHRMLDRRRGAANERFESFVRTEFFGVLVMRIGGTGLAMISTRFAGSGARGAGSTAIERERPASRKPRTMKPCNRTRRASFGIALRFCPALPVQFFAAQRP